MVTKQITIKGSTIYHLLQRSLEQKAAELEITGTLSIHKAHSMTLVISGNKDNIERYITWCEAAAREQGVAIAETKDLGFKAFFNFSQL